MKQRVFYVKANLIFKPSTASYGEVINMTFKIWSKFYEQNCFI